MNPPEKTGSLPVKGISPTSTHPMKAILLCVTLLAAAVSQATAGPMDGSLRLQAGIGRIPATVVSEIERTGQARVIVRLEESDVIALAQQRRSERRIAIDSDELLAEQAQQHRLRKNTVLANLDRRHVKVLEDYEQFPLLYLEVNAEGLEKLLALPEVLGINENRRFAKQLSESLPLIKAPQVHTQGATGSGTAVAVLDTGVTYTLATFGSCSAPGTPSTCKVPYAHDFAPDDGSLDDDSHGTNVAGIVLGVAPDTRILALDVFRIDGFAYDSDLLAALNWVAQNRTAYNIVAANMSLGGNPFVTPCSTDSLAGVITTLKNAGVATVVASGNDAASNGISSPACCPNAVSVAAVYDYTSNRAISWSNCSERPQLDKTTCFSNVASFLTLLAPGAMISAAGYTYGGTSQATPHVAGAVAVMKGAHPLLTVSQTVTKLTTSGAPIDARGYAKTRLDLEAALRFPKLAMAPAFLGFDNMAVGSTSPSQEVIITNSGSLDLVIGTVTVGGANPGDFSKGADSCAGQTLPPTASCAVSVAFSPQSPGIKGASLVITSNDPDTPTSTVPLQGSTSPPLLSVTRGGSGTGSVVSTPSGISCGADCSESYPFATAVTLTATADPGSLFLGWAGPCTGTGNCSLSLGADTAVTASFGPAPPSLQERYDAALPDAVIRAETGDFSENLLCNQPKGVTLSGGWDGSLLNVVGVTTLHGSLTIDDGDVTIDNFIIQ